MQNTWCNMCASFARTVYFSMQSFPYWMCAAFYFVCISISFSLHTFLVNTCWINVSCPQAVFIRSLSLILSSPRTFFFLQYYYFFSLFTSDNQNMSTPFRRHIVNYPEMAKERKIEDVIFVYRHIGMKVYFKCENTFICGMCEAYLQHFNWWQHHDSFYSAHRVHSFWKYDDVCFFFRNINYNLRINLSNMNKYHVDE